MSNLKQNQEPLDDNGKAHGEWLFYYSNGQLRYRSNWVHGIPHGFCEYYYQNGTIWHRGYRNMGRQVGYWHWYNKEYYYLCLI